MPTRPTAVRLDPLTDELVRAEAKRTRRTRSAVLRAVAEEGIRQRVLPGIAFRGGDSRRRAWVIGSGLDVWEIVDALSDFGESPERMAAETDLDERQIRLAAAYRERFPEEIDDAIAENDSVASEFDSRFPTHLVSPD